MTPVRSQLIVVEVDERYFFHRTFHRGRRRRGNWFVGLVERATGKCWLDIVHSRDSSMLEQITLVHVLPGSVVMTNAWGSYMNVTRLNNGVYAHEVVVHAQKFVAVHRPDVHTRHRANVDAS
jgi:ISXO2-like transposase domain